MSRNTTLPWRALLFASALVFTLFLPLPAQSGALGNRHRRAPVGVVLPETYSYGETRFVLVVDSTAASAVTVLLSPQATAADLSDAVRTLLSTPVTSAARNGRAILRVHPRQGAAQRQHFELPWAGHVMADLKGAQVRAIPGVGRGRRVTIWLPLHDRVPSR
jgi:hypothetical protein